MIKLKSNLYNEKMLLKEELIEVRSKKELRQQFLYKHIQQFDIYVYISELDSSTHSIINSFCHFPDFYSVNLTIDVKTEENNNYTYIFTCPLKQIFELILYKNKIKNFNFYLIEEREIASFVKIPLVLYILSGVKLNLLGKPLSIIESFSVFSTFIPLLLMLLPPYLNNNLDKCTGFFLVSLFIVSLVFSLVGINNEMKKHKLKKIIHRSMIRPCKEQVNQFGELQNLIIDNNELVFSMDCYEYLQKYRYTSFLLFIFNLLIIINILKFINVI